MSKRHILLGLVVATGLVLLGLLAVYFQGYVTTRVIGPKGGRIQVKQGETVTVLLGLPAGSAVKVELCQEGVRPERCRTLAGKVSGKQAVVRIPVSYPIGRALLKAMARDKLGRLTGKVLWRRAVLVTRAAPANKAATQNMEESSGGGGGGGAGGDSGGGGGSGGDAGAGSGGGTGGGSAEPTVNYELVSICYEGADDSLHIRYKPKTGVNIRYRVVGESIWSYPGSSTRQKASSMGDGMYFDDLGGDSRKVILSPLVGDLPANTDFEFYLLPGSGAPPGLPAESQIYRYNT
ncbi:MAG: hypothetical protein HY372_02680, partial [Candidatus Andersenbacteria bacterium]|nr:hypothetical protein [Candidatus Andersenbacteria bacterium]